MRLLLLLLIIATNALAAQTSSELFRRGHAHYDADRVDSARHYYQSALAIDTPDVQLRAYTSLLKVAVNRTDHATADSLIGIADGLVGESVTPSTTRKYERMKGTAWSRNGRYRSALQLLQRVAREQELADDPAAAETLIDIALTYKRMYLPDSSVLFADRAHDLYRRTLDTHDVKLGYFYDQIGAVYYGAGRLAESKDFYQRGIGILRRQGETASEGMGLLYNNLANVFTDEGAFAEAFALRDKALSISRSLGLEENYAIGLFNLGVSQYMVGNFGAASQYVEQSIRIREKLVGEGHPSLANSYQARSILQSLSGDDRGAIRSYRQLIDQTRRSVAVDNTLIGGYYDEIGLSYFNLGHLDSAVIHHERAIGSFRTHSREGTDALAISLYNLAAALAEQGRGAEALARIEESERILVRLGFAGGDLYTRVLGSHAMRLAEVGRSAASMKRIEEALDIIRPAGEYALGPGSTDALRLLAAAAFTLYTSDTTRTHLQLYRQLERDFVETAERTRLQFYDPYTKGLLNDRAQQFLRENISRYFTLYERTGNRDYLQRLFELSEYGKATALRDQLRGGVPGYRGVPDSVTGQLESFQQRIESLYFTLEEAPPERRDSLEQRLFTTRRALDSLRVRIAEYYPEYAELFEPREYRAAREELALQSGQTGVVYLRGSEAYYALVITPQALNAVFCGPAREIDSMVVDWRVAVGSVLTREHLAAGHLIYERLWKPIIPYLSGRRVKIVPDGAVHSVAFDALSRSPSAADYLIREYTISYAYSLALLARQARERRVRHPNDFVTVAPGFTRESKSAFAGTESRFHQAASQPFSVDLARRMLRNYQGRTLLGLEATESRVRQAIAAADVLFFATHGYVDETSPLRSGIQLMLDGKLGVTDDGFFSVAEIFNCTIPADLSILGICESGRGKLTPGEGMMSVAYAFTYAGCASTVNTLWSVDDRANAELIDRFVARLAGGEERAEALRAAKLDQLAEAGAGFDHPFYWGALVLQGAEGPVGIKRKWKFSWWIVAVSLLIVVGVPLLQRVLPQAPQERAGEDEVL